ncbi:DUF2621 family protein [Lentibacillus saliphilus]|uniref:DUF2621 family protein n=1 Tax=Lentibacillus saliphilus TaxID=2737028 RepID=UPI001C30A864|nr:DUF2621 family protein [Lentibacillus saliphilus]
MSIFVDLFIILWGFLLIGLMAIGGFFMFRKFLKRLPKEDGKSDMDWEEYYFNETKDSWPDVEKQLLEELVAPVPELFRDVARHKIASKIGELALLEEKNQIDQDLIIRGYIIATPKRDHKFLKKKLKQKKIDIEQYEHLFLYSRDDYEEKWEERYQKQKQQ